MSGQDQTPEAQRGSKSDIDAVVMPYFVCTKCRLHFKGESRMVAECPECGEKYGHFFTQLIRAGSFAEAYWLRDNPGEIRKHIDGA